MFDWIYGIYNSFISFIQTYVFGFAKFVDEWFGGIVLSLIAFLYWVVPWILRRMFPAAIILSATTFLQQGTAAFLMMWAYTTLAKLIGITVVGYVGWNLFIPHVQGFMTAAMTSVPKELLPVIKYLGVPEAINFIFSIFFWVASINAAKYIFRPPSIGH
jgi:Protein of unknown function (DUF2523)